MCAFLCHHNNKVVKFIFVSDIGDFYVYLFIISKYHYICWTHVIITLKWDHLYMKSPSLYHKCYTLLESIINENIPSSLRGGNYAYEYVITQRHDVIGLNIVFKKGKWTHSEYFLLIFFHFKYVVCGHVWNILWSQWSCCCQTHS